MTQEVTVLLRGDAAQIARWLRQPNGQRLIGYCVIILIGTAI